MTARLKAIATLVSASMLLPVSSRNFKHLIRYRYRLVA